ncbi:MAG: hypothetical protein LBR25_10535 [Erysipelotrichaceae bacterium]|jgi:hypothetical protein|nr:hypothetical protein [Erysipelotrichaceae bacterium]
MRPLETIKGFVQGSLSVREFERVLYSDPQLETYLQSEVIQKYFPPIVKGDMYLYLIEQNYKQPGNILNAQSVLADFLKIKGEKFKRSTKYSDLHNLMLEVQPAWLNIADDFFQELLDKHEGKSGAALKNALKNDIKKLFRYVKKPPKWLQEAIWPLENGTPLLFIGELDISTLRHDTATAYVFFNEKQGDYQIIEQAV